VGLLFWTKGSEFTDAEYASLKTDTRNLRLVLIDIKNILDKLQQTISSSA
jgi:hypothetical protein